MLHAYQQWGEGALARLNGMYAFAIWDEGRQELTLVRDRMGVKPLYYYPTPSGLLFALSPRASWRIRWRGEPSIAKGSARCRRW